MDILEMPLVFSDSPVDSLVNTLEMDIARTTSLMQIGSSYPAPPPISHNAFLSSPAGQSAGMYIQEDAHEDLQLPESRDHATRLHHQQLQLHYEMTRFRLGTPPVSPLMGGPMPTVHMLMGHNHSSHTVIPASPSPNHEKQHTQLPRTTSDQEGLSLVYRSKNSGETQSSSQSTHSGCGSPVFNVPQSTHSPRPNSSPFTPTFPTVSEANNSSTNNVCANNSSYSNTSPLIAGFEANFDLFPLQFPSQVQQQQQHQQHQQQQQHQQHQQHQQYPSLQQPQPSSALFDQGFVNHQGSSYKGDCSHPQRQHHQHTHSEGSLDMVVSTKSAPPGPIQGSHLKQTESEDDFDFSYYNYHHRQSLLQDSPQSVTAKRRPKSMIDIAVSATAGSPSPVTQESLCSPSVSSSSTSQYSSNTGSLVMPTPQSPVSRSPGGPFVYRPERRRSSSTSASFLPYTPPNHGTSNDQHQHSPQPLEQQQQQQQQPMKPPQHHRYHPSHLVYQAQLSQQQSNISLSSSTLPQHQQQHQQQQQPTQQYPQHHLHHLLDPLQVPEITDIHECPVCHRRFTRPFNLRSHIITHTTLRPYPCDECHWKFTRQHDLLRHKRAKHPQSVAHLPPPGAKKAQAQGQQQQQQQQQQQL